MPAGVPAATFTLHVHRVDPLGMGFVLFRDTTTARRLVQETPPGPQPLGKKAKVVPVLSIALFTVHCGFPAAVRATGVLALNVMSVCTATIVIPPVCKVTGTVSTEEANPLTIPT